MAVSITKRTLAGFNEYLLRYVNVMCYEHEISITDLVKAGVLSAKQEGITKQGNIFLFNGQKSMSCDMIDVLRAKPELFQQDVVKGMDFWA